jgi:hypothetical protein
MRECIRPEERGFTIILAQRLFSAFRSANYRPPEFLVGTSVPEPPLVVGRLAERARKPTTPETPGSTNVSLTDAPHDMDHAYIKSPSSIASVRHVNSG